MDLTRSDPKAGKPRRGPSLTQGERRFALLLTLPTLIAVFFVVAYPWAYSFWMSLHDVGMVVQKWTFVGLKNYAQVISEPLFLDSLLRTAYFTVFTVTLGILLGLGMALVLNEAFPGRGIMRSVLLVPWAMSSVVVGILFAWIYDGQYGVLNAALTGLGLIQDYVPWLRNGFAALNLVGLAWVWHTAPLAALLLLAGLQAIPPNLYNAAKIDGAGAWHRFWHITLPWLRPMLLNALILASINAIMAFDIIYVITSGGPGTATTVLSWYGYVTTFNFSRFGEGTAILYILSLLSLLLALLYMRVLQQAAPKSKKAAATKQEPFPPQLKAEYVGGPALTEKQPKSKMTKTVTAARRPFLSYQAWQRIRRFFLFGFVALVAAWSLLPFFWLVLCSILPSQDLIGRPPTIDLSHVTFKHYIGLFVAGRSPEALRLPTFMTQMPLALWNSFVVSVSVTIVSLLVGSLAGYAHARYSRFPFMSTTLIALLMTRMIPAMAIVIPFFIFFRRMGLQDTKLGLVIAFSAFVLPLAVWIMRGYFETVPVSLDRAALVDGCTRLQAFIRIILPVSRPGLMATGMFCFVVAWNQFIFALILSTSIRSQTIPVFLSVMRKAAQQYFSDYSPLFAATVLGALPAVIIAFVFQRYLIQGMLSGSAKG